MQPLVEGTAERWLYFFAKGSRMRGGGVSVKIRLRIPDGEDHVVVGAAVLAYNFDPRASRVLAAVRSELPEERIRRTQSARRRDHVDDGHDVDALFGSRLLSGADGQRKKKPQGDKKSMFGHYWILTSMPGEYPATKTMGVEKSCGSDWLFVATA